MIEQEYKTWLSKFKGDKYYAEKYFLAHKGAIRLKPCVVNFTIQDVTLYETLKRELNKMNEQIAYRQYAERKRLEAEENSVEYDMSVFEPQKEINVDEIPF
jgi:hypothetical protein